jgi:hypothetical protein
MVAAFTALRSRRRNGFLVVLHSKTRKNQSLRKWSRVNSIARHGPWVSTAARGNGRRSGRGESGVSVIPGNVGRCAHVEKLGDWIRWRHSRCSLQPPAATSVIYIFPRFTTYSGVSLSIMRPLSVVGDRHCPCDGLVARYGWAVCNR